MKRFYYYTPLTIQSFFFIFFLPLYKFFIHLEINGRDYLKNIKGPIIFAANHTSELDPTVIPLVTNFFSKKLPVYSVIYPVDKYNDADFGWRRHIYKNFFFHILGGYSVNSGNKSYEKSLENHIELLRQGKTVCIFPEGKFTIDGYIGKARGGLGYLVYKTGATVVPIAINTFHDISWGEFILRKRKVSITVVKPISATELIFTNNPNVDDYRIVSEVVLDQIKDVIYR